MEMVEAALAKVNLYLRVVGRRADGYHLLDMLIAFASVGDTVAASPADGLSLEVDGPFAPTLQDEPAENLVLRAARILAEVLGRRPDVALRLTKRLPVASGIGGGSSDAAATLRLLGRLWSAPDALLMDLALRLTADGPVCLRAVPARVGGIGEILQPVPPLPPLAIVLVNPRQPLSTPAVFKARRGPFSPPAEPYPRWDSTADLVSWLRPLGNDLAEPATGMVPAIAGILDALARTPDCLLARLSGSGATCFGLYATPAQAVAAAGLIRQRTPDWWIETGTVAPARSAD
jgi:4-diphosphocytidyl-2-C-methyl-D-erythritol kinase